MPRFTLEELRETLKGMDLTPKPETEESMQAHVALLEDMRPYRERAWHPERKEGAR